MATSSQPIPIPSCAGLSVFEASPEERALQKCYTDLCDNLDAKAVLPHLYEECAISKRTYRDVRAKLGCDPSGAVEDFLLSLSSRAVRALCAVLLHNEHTRKLGVRLQEGGILPVVHTYVCCLVYWTKERIGAVLFYSMFGLL